MSDGGRERASLGVNVWKSSRKWSVQRSAVRSIAWLDLLVEFTIIFERLLDNIPGAWVGRMPKRLKDAKHRLPAPVGHNRKVNKLVGLARVHSEIRDKLWNGSFGGVRARELLASLPKPTVWAALITRVA
jgi:hypothetical protein